MDEENNTERKFHDYGVGVYADDAERVAKVTAFIKDTFEGCEPESYTIREKATSQDGKPRVGGTFGVALQAMKYGKGARLPHWEGGKVLRVQEDHESGETLIFESSGSCHMPWTPNHTEMLQENWEIVD